jgi:hypothetical protein
MANNWIPSMWEKKYASERTAHDYRCDVCGNRADVIAPNGGSYCRDCVPYENLPCDHCGAPSDTFTRSGEAFCDDCNPYDR